jgi:hypothetical protein
MKTLHVLAVIGIIFTITACSPMDTSETADMTSPIVGSARRYCNPLSIESSSQDGFPRGISLGDVTIIQEGNLYYMFCTGGGAWVSKNLVDWKFRPVEGRVPVAPHVVKYNGEFYMTGNSSPLYKASNILGPYESIGEWKDHKGEPWTGISNGKIWTNSFDMDIFIDDDNTPYLYYPGRSTDGIYVVPLDPNDLTQFAAEPIHLFGFDKSHVWERYDDMNEYSENSWVEGPWVFKHNGTYYLQYSASGTQWLTYATGVYTSKHPLGPFTYAPINPILRKTTGIVTGAGHGCCVVGPDGNWWQFYTLVLANPPGGRRLGIDPIGFDEDGNMFVKGPTETPQWAPGVVLDPVRDCDSGSLPLNIGKVRAMNSRSSFSSERPGHEAAYAIDNSNGTWWEPAEGDSSPSLTIDLGPATEFDPVQEFTIDSCRIEFRTGGRWFGFGRSGPEIVNTGSNSHRYKIEASDDGENFTTVLDKTENMITKYIEFEEIPPTKCRFIRFTITDWPRIGDTPLGIMEFTVFGKPVETL